MVKDKKNTTVDKKMLALQTAMQQIQKSFGKEAVMDLGNTTPAKVDVISTGSKIIDHEITGIGGIPKGRITEIYGPESSGKTTLTLQLIASCQAKGGNCVFIDVEQALDLTYAKNLGVQIDKLFLSQPDNAEQALEILETFVNSGGADLIIVDSVAALSPKAEIDGDMEDQHVGLQARLLSKGLRKITGPARNHNVAVVFINQLRDNIGAMGYGPKEITPGGKALKFYASLRIDLRRKSSMKKGDTYIGNIVKVKAAKNKLAPPFREGEVEVYFGEGISKWAEVLNTADKLKIVDKSGAWYSYNGEKIGQGKDNAITFLKENPSVFEEIEAKVYDSLYAKKEEA